MNVILCHEVFPTEWRLLMLSFNTIFPQDWLWGLPWPSQNPGRDACVLNYNWFSITQEYKWGPVRAEMVIVFDHGGYLHGLVKLVALHIWQHGLLTPQGVEMVVKLVALHIWQHGMLMSVKLDRHRCNINVCYIVMLPVQFPSKKHKVTATQLCISWHRPPRNDQHCGQNILLSNTNRRWLTLLPSVRFPCKIIGLTLNAWKGTRLFPHLASVW